MRLRGREWRIYESDLTPLRLLRGLSLFRTCGSALQFMGEGFVVVPAGSLDAEEPRKPEAHLFAGSRASWDHCLEQLPAFESLPT